VCACVHVSAMCMWCAFMPCVRVYAIPANVGDSLTVSHPKS